MKKAIIFFISVLLFSSILLFSILITSVQAQASIIISTPNEIYNLGDNIEIETTISYPEQINGFLQILLVCEEQENLIYFSPTIIETQEKTIDVSFPVSEAQGSCYISVAIENDKKNILEEKKTQNIILTDKIDINIELNKEEYEPSDNLIIEGQAIKENSQFVDGSMKISFDNEEYSASITGGEFSLTIKLPLDIIPGYHDIVLNTEDSKGNIGEETFNFKMKQIPTSLLVELNNESFFPDEILLITPKLLDQAEGIIEDKNVNVKIIAKEDMFFFLDKKAVFMDESVQSGTESMYRFAKDTPPREYFIKATFNDDFVVEKSITIKEYEKVEFTLENDTLIITNIGNVPYTKPLEIEFKIHDQTTTEIIELNLDVGETKVFKLEAPKGTYNLEIAQGDGNEDDDKEEFVDVPLTGSIVASVELNNRSNLNKKGILWFIPILALLFLFVFFVNKRKNTYKAPTKEEKQKEKIKAKTIKIIEKQQKTLRLGMGKIDLDIKKIFNQHTLKNLAAQTIMPTMVYGTKQEISVLFMTIYGFDKFDVIKKKDPQLFKKVLNNYFDAITKKIKAHQGVADLYGNNLVIFFNIVKQNRYDVAAIKTAKEIRQITHEFNEYTKKLKLNTNINLTTKSAINTGLIVTTNIGADKTVKYTAIGNTINLAKALNNKALENEILIPDAVYNKVYNIIKAKKILPLHLTNTEAINVYLLQDSSKLYLQEKYVDYVKRKIQNNSKKKNL